MRWTLKYINIPKKIGKPIIIRNVSSLSEEVANIIQIIKDTEQTQAGFKLEHFEIKVTCYAGHKLLTAENEDDHLRLII